MFVVAETFAETCGKPVGPAAREIALMVDGRPLTEMCLLLAITNCCRRLKKPDR